MPGKSKNYCSSQYKAQVNTLRYFFAGPIRTNDPIPNWTFGPSKTDYLMDVYFINLSYDKNR